MLQKLHIEHYALIDKLDVSFKNGFTVITGETGAGKSILLGALSLILGQRAESRVIKEGFEKCVVEAEFDIHAYGLETFFEQNDLEYIQESCLIRRELFRSGKSRAFINDSPVSLAMLKDLTAQLIDIHSQHQNLLLGNDVYQLNILDSVAKNEALLNEYRTAYLHFRERLSALKKLEDTARKAREEEDYLRFQFNQIDEARLKEGEQEELEAEMDLLTHAEEIKLGLGRIFQLLDEEGHGINTLLHLAMNQAESLQKVYSRLQESCERIHSSYLDMKDLSGELEALLNDVEVNPERMEQVNDRMNQLYSLQQKHRVRNTQGLIDLKEDLSEKLSVIDSFENQLTDLKNEMNDAESLAQNLADKLTASRSFIRGSIEERLVRLLKEVGIPKAVLQIEQKRKPMESDGQDQINFLFSANKNTTPQSINQIASGGEISRIMLSIKSLIAEFSSLPTLLFDEIDAGVSGEIADKMGQIMKGIAGKRQVICITHLPQIAAKGEDHFKVYKTEQNDSSMTAVKRLREDERLLEIAQMLSGANVSKAAVSNAQALLLENQ
ncbi:MAG: DNA repair protein RecN [Bacteroidales bacterium]|nr:DNA repair protein RecN [Bacteroidales bacterium]